MKRFASLRALALGLLVSSSPTALSTAPALAQAKIGTSAGVQGNVFVRGGGSAEQRRAAVRDSIFLQDQVITRQESAIQILLLDASIFTVGENCELVIDRFVYDPDTGAGQMSANVVRGAFRFMSGRIGANNPTDADIRTPSALIGIRGTFLECSVGADAILLARLAGLAEAATADPVRASLCCLRGPAANTPDRRGVISVTNPFGRRTAEKPNTCIFDPGNGAPVGPFEAPDDVISYFDVLLRTDPSGGPFELPDEEKSPSTAANDPQDEYPDDDPDLNGEPPEFGEALEEPPPAEPEEEPPPPEID